jgi:hypothetical protein
MSYEDFIPKDLLKLYEIEDYRHAAAILANEFPQEFKEICEVLRQFRITEADITEKGGSESQIPKKLSLLLRPLGWNENKLSAKMVVDEKDHSVDSHLVDYLKGRVAFDLEWNSKDQTFDRDLYAFRMFWEYNKISVGVIVTRGRSMNELFEKLNVKQKYGASTTWMGKLTPRLNAGRNGGCPVLVFGMTPKLLTKK